MLFEAINGRPADISHDGQCSGAEFQPFAALDRGGLGDEFVTSDAGDPIERRPRQDLLLFCGGHVTGRAE